MALAIMALCLLPFIPKSGERFLKMKQMGSYTLFSHDFESRLCSLREQALLEGQTWIQGKKEGEVIFKVKDTISFEDLSLKAKVSGKLVLKKIYAAKTGSKTFYRLKLKLEYQGTQDKKYIQTFTGYMALEE